MHIVNRIHLIEKYIKKHPLGGAQVGHDRGEKAPFGALSCC